MEAGAYRAVVVTVIVVLAPGVTEDGLNVAAAPVGKPEAEKVTELGNVPLTGAVAIVNIADPPAVTVSVPVVLDRVKSTMANVSPFDVPPPGAELNTVTVEVPDFEISDAGTTAVNWVELTYVVTSAVAFQSTTEVLTKPVPFTVSVNWAPPVIAELGTSGDVSVDTGLLTVNCTAGVDAEVYPLLLVYAAETVCVPTLRPVSVVVATPLTRLTGIVEVSTVNTTVPAGVTVEPETVALTVTD